MYTHQFRSFKVHVHVGLFVIITEHLYKITQTVGGASDPNQRRQYNV